MRIAQKIDNLRVGRQVVTYRREAKAAPFIWPDWRMGAPQWKLIDYSTYAQEGFSQNAVIYSAIMYKARSMIIAPLRAWTGDMENREPVKESHPLAQLVARPNKHQSWVEFQQQGIVYLNISGNNYTYLDRSGTDALPDAMYNLRPDRVFTVPGRVSGNYGVMGYLYAPEGKAAFMKLDRVSRRRRFESGEVRAFVPEDIMHVKLPNPLDPLEGMGDGLSPIAPMAWSADVDNSVTKFLKLFFERGVMVPGILSSENPLTDTDAARMKERWKEIYGGFERWAQEIGVLGKGAKYQRVGLTFDEMGFEAIDERNESRMTGPFGVQPILIGARLGLTRSSYGKAYFEARQAFWQDTMVPETRLFEVEYQYYLQTDDAFVAYDFSQVPALQTVELEKRQNWLEAFKAGSITRNEYRLKAGLQEDPRGDVYLTPMAMIEVPFGASVEAAPVKPVDTEMEESPEATEDTRKALPIPRKELPERVQSERKLRLWKAVSDIAESWETRFAEKAEAAFGNDERALLARLHDARRKAVQDKQSVDYQKVARDWDEYFRTKAPENWREEFYPVITGVISSQAESWNTAFGISFDVQNVFAAEAAGDFFREFMQGFSQDIVDTTRNDMAAIIQQALQNGWTVDETSKQLGMTFERYTELGYLPEEGRRMTEEEIAWFTERRPLYRRDNIARTETMRASNAGSLALFDAWGVVEKKEWLATGDARTRDDHLTAWSQYSEGGDPGPILLNQAFIVGGASMMYPGDPSGPPEQVCQCRCTVLPFFEAAAGTQEQIQRQRERIEVLQGEQQTD